MAKTMAWWQKTAIILVGVGSVNWLLDRILTFNLVDAILDPVKMSFLNKTVYALVGVAGVYTLYWLFFGKK